MSDPLDLARIEARLNAATPGPCPFCDGDADAGHTGVWWVKCANPDCGAEGPTRDTEEECVAAWHDIPNLRALLAEVRRLTDANTRLTDLVRHQRGALHTEGLITNAEYAALAGLTGSPARLEGYDALRGELALQTRATNVAIGERDAANRDADTYRQILAGKMRRTDLAAAQNGDLMPGPLAVASLILADMIEAKPEAKNRLSWSWTDARTGKGYRVMVEHENGESFADALATARLDGARAMREAAAAHLLAPERRMAYVQAGPRCLAVAADEIAALDPAAVVGSGS